MQATKVVVDIAGRARRIACDGFGQQLVAIEGVITADQYLAAGVALDDAVAVRVVVKARIDAEGIQATHQIARSIVLKTGLRTDAADRRSSDQDEPALGVIAVHRDFILRVGNTGLASDRIVVAGDATCSIGDGGDFPGTVLLDIREAKLAAIRLTQGGNAVAGAVVSVGAGVDLAVHDGTIGGTQIGGDCRQAILGVIAIVNAHLAGPAARGNCAKLRNIAIRVVVKIANVATGVRDLADKSRNVVGIVQAHTALVTRSNNAASATVVQFELGGAVIVPQPLAVAVYGQRGAWTIAVGRHIHRARYIVAIKETCAITIDACYGAAGRIKRPTETGDEFDQPDFPLRTVAIVIGTLGIIGAHQGHIVALRGEKVIAILQ